MAARTDLDVLLADADDRRREHAAGVLRSVGWSVREAASAAAAVEACREALPDVLLLDLDAPGAHDLEILEQIKSDPDLFSVSVVVRGRTLDVQDALDALARGAHGMLVDPVADAELVAGLRSAAQVGVLQQELRSRAASLERLAFSDGLTAVPNRRFLDRQLAALLSAARRHGRPLSVALIDLDHFKAINDRHGHAVGDAVLVEAARRLQARLRSEDHLGRYGGEEFLVLLPDTDERAAAAVGEDLRLAICGERFHAEGGSLEVTASVGCATWENAEHARRLIARADAALYRAKADGRNLVRTTAEVPSAPW